MRLGADASIPRAADDPLSAEAVHVLDRRLRPASPRPLAVGLSGGGDSLALTLIAQAWAARRGRRLLVLTVDHGLRPESVAWTDACAAVAARLGAEFRALAWDGPKPAAGLPAAARAARHALLAQAGRDAGACVILLGHTADDLAEAQAMRADGGTTPSPREWAPSPAWPEGRGVFLLRPLLALRRAALREWLAARGERWIDDPANEDPRFARARARAAGPAEADAPVAPPIELARRLQPIIGGGFALDRATLRQALEDEAQRLVALACVCAGGGARLPRRERVAALAARLRAEERFEAGLAGARIVAGAHRILFAREAGEAARGGLPLVALEPRRATVWDGRFEIEATAGWTVRPLRGLAPRLPADQRRALAGLPAAVRAALPLLQGEDGRASCPLLGPVDGVRIEDLTASRLAAAAGLAAREPD